MKAWLTYSKGLTAILLLSSVSCMNKGFQALTSQTEAPVASDQATPSQQEWPFEDIKPWADDEDAPVQQSTLKRDESAPKETTWTAEPSTPGQKNEMNPLELDKGETPAAAKREEPKGPEKKEDQTKEEKAKTEKSARVQKAAQEEKVDSSVAETSDFTGPGILKPTIYYFPTFNEDDSKCEKNSMMHAAGGKDMLMVCEKTAKECGLQGSCAIIQNGVTRSFNVLGARNGQDRFFEIKDACKYGFGVENACLDPFYTLAADLNLYEPGQVIFVPAVVGTLLPDGSKHSGYFVIRDRGRGVTGTGRFDFFSGIIAWKDSKNPFTKMGLGDVKTNIPYFKVKGKTAQQVLRHRAFPKLPAK